MLALRSPFTGIIRFLAAAIASLFAVAMLVEPASAAPAVLALTKEVSRTTVEPGQQFNYALTASCSGLTEGCVNATVTDILPAEFEVSSLPQSTSERTVTYDPVTRLLTVVFTIPLTNPSGKKGLPTGRTRVLSIGMRLPAETAVTDGQVIPNTADFNGLDSTNQPLVPVSSSVDITATVPVVVRPVATKTWAPPTAIAQSGETSTITLGIRNASSTSADVRQLTVDDGNNDGGSAATFDYMNVTSLGPVVSYPPGTDQVIVSVCTVIPPTPCTDADLLTSAPLTGNGPFDPATIFTPAVALSDITYVRYTFQHSGSTTIPFSADQGQVETGVVLRNTLRSTGAPIQPQTPQKLTNIATPTAIDNLAATTLGASVTAPFTIQPDTIAVLASKKMFADNIGSWSPNGEIVVGQDSGITMQLGVTNISVPLVKTLTILEPSPNAPTSEFAKIDIDRGRFTWPAGATQATLTVTCRSGANPAPVVYQRAGAAIPTQIPSMGCDAGVAPASIELTYEGADGLGNGTIESQASAGLDLHGTAPGVDSTDVSNTLINCVEASGATPLTSSAGSIACEPVTVANPVSGIGGEYKNSAGVSTIVPGQPLKFFMGLRNSGNVPANGVYFADPPDPTATPNSFSIVRVSAISTSATPAHVTELYDPTVGAYVPYVASNTSLLTRATGFRVRLTAPLPVGAAFSLNYTVLVRDGIAAETPFTNCAEFGIDGAPSGQPRCSPTVTVKQGNSTSASLDKLFSVYDLIRPEPGLKPQITQVKHRVSNNGPLYLKRLQFTDADANFFDAVTFAGNMRVNFPPGANFVQVDACTTGCQSSPPVFVLGTPTGSSSPGLPAGVAAADVQGIRVTFSNSNGGYELLPTTNFPNNGACRNASFCFDVRANEFLRSAPTTPIPSTVTDTSDGGYESALQTPGTLAPLAPVSEAFNLTPGVAEVKFSKGPGSRIAPGDTAPFDLTIENTGTTALVNPVITDPIPDELTLEDDAPGGAPGRPFVVSYPALPSGYAPLPSASVDYTPTVVSNKTTSVSWTFTGWSLPPGGKVSIRIYVRLSPGTLADTSITNTAGASGSNQNLTCAVGNTSSTDPIYGTGTFCLASAVIDSLPGNSVNAAKWSAGDPDLGWQLTTTGEILSQGDPLCPMYIEGGVNYTRYPCAPLVRPGGEIQFLIHLVNAGTNPLDHAVIEDGVPVQGDTGVLLSGSPRGTEWNNRPTMLTPVTPVETYSGITTDYTNAAFPGFCTADIQPSGTCPTDPFTAPFSDTNTGFRTNLNFPSDARLQPGEGVTLTWSMLSPLSLTTNLESPQAWNSFAQKSTFWNGSSYDTLAPTEPLKAGAVMRFNTAAVAKSLLGEIPVGAATSYEIGYRCLVGDTDVANGTLTFSADDVSSGDTKSLPFVPVGAVCLIWENTLDGGSSPNQGEANAIPLVILDPSQTETAQTVTITNSFDSGLITVRKLVSGPGANLALQGGGTLGTQSFPVTVECAYPPGTDQIEPGLPLLPAFPKPISLRAGTPQSISASSGTVVTAGARCTATESAGGGATSTTIVADDDIPDSGPTAAFTARAVDDGGSLVTLTNVFDVGTLVVKKVVSGVPPAGLTFPMTVSCTLPGPPSLALADQTFSLAAGASKSLTVAAGATCVVHETNSHGGVVSFTDSDGTNNGTVVVGASAQTSVTVRNAFNACTVTANALRATTPVKRSGVTQLVASASTQRGCALQPLGPGSNSSSVHCVPTGISVLGELRYCRATLLSGGRVLVQTKGYPHVRITLTLVALPKPGITGVSRGTFTRTWFTK